MSETRNLAEMASHFDDYISQVVNQGASFIVIRDNEPVAELRPLQTRLRLKHLPSLWAKLPSLAEGDAESFANDLEATCATSRACPG